jgi:hypothetical protein
MPFPVKCKVLVQGEVVALVLNDDRFEEKKETDSQGIFDDLMETPFGKNILLPAMKFGVKNCGILLLISLLLMLCSAILSSLLTNAPRFLDALFAIGLIGMFIFGIWFMLTRNEELRFSQPGTRQVVKIPGAPKEDGVYTMTIKESDGSFCDDWYKCEDYDNGFNLSHIQFKNEEDICADRLRSFSIPNSRIKEGKYQLDFEFELLYPIDLRN